MPSRPLICYREAVVCSSCAKITILESKAAQFYTSHGETHYQSLNEYTLDRDFEPVSALWVSIPSNVCLRH